MLNKPLDAVTSLGYHSKLMTCQGFNQKTGHLGASLFHNCFKIMYLKQTKFLYTAMSVLYLLQCGPTRSILYIISCTTTGISRFNKHKK